MRVALIVLCLAISMSAYFKVSAQDRYAEIGGSIEELSKNTPGLNEPVELSVNDVSLTEFIRGLAIGYKLNISVDPNLKTVLSNNFAGVAVKDVLLYLCKQYELDIQFTGSIMTISKFSPQPVAPEPYVRRRPKIVYHDTSDFLSLDLRKDSLELVAREITELTLRNIILAPGLEGRQVGVFIKNRPFDDALDKFAFANNLSITKTEGNFYLIENKKSEKTKGGTKKTPKGTYDKTKADILDVNISDAGRLNIYAVNAPIADIVAAVSAEMGRQFYLFNIPTGTTSLYVENATYDEFLNNVFNGTEFTFHVEDDVYYIGERQLEGLRATELIQLEYRTVETIKDIIPAELRKGVSIQEFVELNSLIVSGSHPRIREIRDFIKKVDKVVPVILIEVIIVDVRKSKSLSTGIQAGLGTAPSSTGGTVLSGIDISLSSNAINNVISGINGLGVVNLGKVVPEFYLTLQAMEAQGLLNIRSTPQLATLNGHEASMSSGETRYYLETKTTLVGSVTTASTVSQTYKSINADLSISIKPFVSGDDQITMEISVNQSSFGEQISETAPFGTVTRNFKSLIRVKNEEMILLGGLEENTVSESGSGVPLLTRIPIIKWFFSGRKWAKNKNKLSIFIKPTIVY